MTDSVPEVDNAQQTGSAKTRKLPIWARGLILLLVLLIIMTVVWLWLFSEGQPLRFGREPRIVFMSDRGQSWDLYLAAQDGDMPVNLTNSESLEALPTWAPGQERLLFFSNRGQTGEFLFLLDLKANSVQTISVTLPGSPIPIAFSADGRYLTVQIEQEQGPGHFIVDLETEQLIDLSEQQGEVVNFGAWSPDGYRFILATSTPQGVELFVTDLSGERYQSLTDGSYIAGQPDWSPDGQKVLFIALLPESNTSDIFVINLADEQITNLTNTFTDNESFPRWSPDGSKIAFGTDRHGNNEVYVMEANGESQLNLTNHPATESPRGDFAWSPDGQQILFHSDRDNNVEVYRVNVSGQTLVNVSNSQANDFGAIWIP
jgi:Tol biopolymer transport system component